MNIATNGFVFDQYGNVLLIRRDDTRTFAPPGGTLDAGELPTDGCAREVREETGLIVYPVRLVGMYFQDIAEGGMLLLSFRCIQRGGDITPSPESPLVAWFKAHKLPSPMLSFHRERTRQALAHDGGPPVWTRYNWSLMQKFGRFLVTNIVYRWKDWQRKRRGEPPYQPPPAWQTGAFTIIRNAEGRVLWVKRTDRDIWNLPGGVSEPDEAPWETAVRETREETGLHVKLVDLSSVNVYHDLPNMTFNFTAEISRGALTTGPEAAEFAWFTPGAEPGNCVQQHVERVADAAGPSTETVFRHQPGPQGRLG